MPNIATTSNFGKFCYSANNICSPQQINWTLKCGSKIFKLSEFSEEIGLEPQVRPGNTGANNWWNVGIYCYCRFRGVGYAKYHCHYFLIDCRFSHMLITSAVLD